MRERTVLLLATARYEILVHSGLLAVTAASLGDEVLVMPVLGVLKRWARATLDLSPAEVGFPERQAALNLPPPSELFAQAKQLGARVFACDTHARLAGVTSADLSGKVDEMIALPTFWKLTAGARVLNF